MFLDIAVQDLKDNGMKVVFSRYDRIRFEDDSSLVLGYFDPHYKILKLANIEENFSTFIHEYNHFKQHQENTEIWRLDLKSDLWDWVAGKIEYTPEKLEKRIASCRDVELDCERRTLIMIKKFGLSVDLKEYTKEAASYVYYYNYLAKSRKWFKRTEAPYNNKELLAAMPKNLNGDFSKTPKRIWKLYEKYYGN